MESDDASEHTISFQLQFNKPLASQVKIAEWNPEKDLLSMVTDDSKILLHRFNWQRLWTVSPGKSITSLCWRPDGKAIAVGLEDGTISLHDVEVFQVEIQSDSGNSLAYEDRTPRFFPPAPRAPRVAGVVTSDASFMDDNEDSYRQLSNSSYQRFNILCSGDKDGSIFYYFNAALDSSPHEEFLSLLVGARTSPAVHQFLVNTLGEVVSFILLHKFHFSK
ncbi:Anaphase-promoting complex subunit 4 [Linum perenne]